MEDLQGKSLNILEGAAQKPEMLQQQCLLDPTLIEDWKMDSLQDNSQDVREIPQGLSNSDGPGNDFLAEAIKKHMNLDSRMVSSTPIVPASTSLMPSCPDMYGLSDEQPSARSHTIEPKVPRKEDVSSSESQFSALADQCDYIRKIMKNFNIHIASMPMGARSMVQTLNSELQSICAAANPVDESIETNSETDSVEFNSRAPSRKVTFGEHPPLGVNVDHTARNVPIERLAMSKAMGPLQQSLSNNHEGTRERPPIITSNTQNPLNSRRFESLPLTPTNYSSQDTSNGSRSTESLSVTDLLQVLQRLDSRSVPKPDVYDLTSGQPVSEFISTFEEYCRGTFRGSSSLWVGELGRMLTGEIKVALDAMKAPGDTYETLKEKLMRWVNSRQELLQNGLKNKFKTAQMKPQESYTLYAARLENLFSAAYPRRLIQDNRTLRTKYFDTVHESFRNQLQTTQAITKSMNERDMTWSQVIAYASQHEVENNNRPLKIDSNEVWAVQPSVTVSSNQHVKTQPSNTRQVGSETSLHREDAKPIPLQLFHNAGSNSIRDRELGRSLQPHRNSESNRYELSESARPMSRDGMLSCFHCQKTGHSRKDCWRRLNLCLVCGSSDHRIATCPNRRSQAPERSSSSTGHYSKTTDSRILQGCRQKDYNDHLN